jgi:uncharacterized membrane-anchored protein
MKKIVLIPSLVVLSAFFGFSGSSLPMEHNYALFAVAVAVVGAALLGYVGKIKV